VESKLVCIFSGMSIRCMGEVKFLQYDEPDISLGDTKKIAFLCEECAVIHWAFPVEDLQLPLPFEKK